MSKETTPMQELILKLIDKKDEHQFNTEYDNGVRRGLALSIVNAKQLLEKERQDLEDTYDKGMGARHPTGHGMSFDEYYNEKFNQA